MGYKMDCDDTFDLFNTPIFGHKIFFSRSSYGYPYEGEPACTKRLAISGPQSAHSWIPTGVASCLGHLGERHAFAKRKTSHCPSSYIITGHKE